jgi:hypothetical protein
MSKLGRKRNAALKLMLAGLLGIGIALPITIELFKALGFELRPAFWISIAAGIPLAVLYLWCNRSSDNTRFELK